MFASSVPGQVAGGLGLMACCKARQAVAKGGRQERRSGVQVSRPISVEDPSRNRGKPGQHRSRLPVVLSICREGRARTRRPRGFAARRGVVVSGLGRRGYGIGSSARVHDSGNLGASEFLSFDEQVCNPHDRSPVGFDELNRTLDSRMDKAI